MQLAEPPNLGQVILVKSLAVGKRVGLREERDGFPTLVKMVGWSKAGQ